MRNALGWENGRSGREVVVNLAHPTESDAQGRPIEGVVRIPLHVLEALVFRASRTTNRRSTAGGMIARCDNERTKFVATWAPCEKCQNEAAIDRKRHDQNVAQGFERYESSAEKCCARVAAGRLPANAQVTVEAITLRQAQQRASDAFDEQAGDRGHSKTCDVLLEPAPKG